MGSGTDSSSSSGPRATLKQADSRAMVRHTQPHEPTESPTKMDLAEGAGRIADENRRQISLHVGTGDSESPAPTASPRMDADDRFDMAAFRLLGT